MNINSQQKNTLLNATQKIAPSWPLDKFIAVNPLWSLVNKPFDTVATQLSALAGIKMHLPIQTYVNWFQEGRISNKALVKAAHYYRFDSDCDYESDEWIEALSKPKPQVSSWCNIADLVDKNRSANKVSWQEEVTHQISQFCAAHYQKISPSMRQMNTNNHINLYAHWLEVTTEDKGLSIILGEPKLIGFFKQLPKQADELLALAIEELELDDSALGVYAHALLLDINGWSSYLAYLKWQSSENQEEDLTLLLAIKMAWELVIWRYSKQNNTDKMLEKKWKIQKQTINQHIAEHKDALLVPNIWALALEYTEQQHVNNLLTSQPDLQKNAADIQLQAIFCIDVRSEVFRRALEKQSDAIQTMGFAGFFGLPIEYKAKNSNFARPQLPGLLQPAITVSEQNSNEEHVQYEQQQARWQRWGHSAPATFSMVESTGWWYGFKMLKQTLTPKREEHPAERLATNTQWDVTQKGEALNIQDKAELAKGILDTIGIEHYAETVLLVGHGSQTSNNLHAAGLECGACGGQSGEVNVKVLASLLNDPEVRACLATMDIDIPENTHFVAALHNTTTDKVTCFDGGNSHHQYNAVVQHWLEEAMFSAQEERAKKLDDSLIGLSNKDRNIEFLKRANDWSQVNPEWGLANNNAFIIAPRHKTRQLNMEGRSFLHDYDHHNDEGFEVLERLLTAPMLVTHWINMQYNLSVTDNYKFGSGNKVLHNAVGGNIGVFEGNGGDLRIGLSMQSISDGENWMHTPVRLSVYIDAPKQAIEKIAAKHDIVRQLIDNDWLYLFCWQDKNLERFYQQKWFS